MRSRSGSRGGGGARGSARLRLALRVLVSVGLLAVVAWRLDAGAVAARLSTLDPGWVVAALALTVVQVGVSTWRWCFTAARLGIRLPFPAALGEYYLATFLNQVLPGGVVGDVSRAWRHAAAADRAGLRDGTFLRSRATHAVVVERLSGQVVMTGVAVLSVAVLLPGLGLPLLVGVLALAVAGVLVARGMGRAGGAGFTESVRTSFLAPSALGPQLVSSGVVVASYVACYLAAARAVGVETPLGTLAPLVAPVLVTMLLPVSVAGWGVREAAAGALWGAVGLTATDGVAISVAYGLLVLLSSLPGALLLLTGIPGGRGAQAPGGSRRREGPSPGGSAGPGGAAPRPASRSPEG